MRESQIRALHLASWGGSTFEAIAIATKSGELKGLIKSVAVISSNPDAPAIQKAMRLKIPAYTLQRKSYPSLEAYGEAILKYARDVDLILQNGWLQYTPSNVIDAFPNWIFNQHPGDPHTFGGKGMHGLAVHAAVLKFQELTGRTFSTEPSIHHVTTKVDGGAVVFHTEVPVKKGDTPETLAARVLPQEHEAHIIFLKEFHANNGKATIQERKEPLLQPGEEVYLQQAIEYARAQYPKG